MNWTIPGTVLSARREDASQVSQQFTSMFLGGGIVLSQISAITGLEPYTIQNWVKRELLPPPSQKRYNMNQLCRIVTINMLKSAIPMEKIIQLISYVNGKLEDESDDLIDDAALYFLFVQMAAMVKSGLAPEELEKTIEKGLAHYSEPVPGAKERIRTALKIMLTAWFAAQLRDKAEAMLETL